MSLIIYNGSPRGKSSNSKIISEWFLDGYGTDETETRFIHNGKNNMSYASEMSNYDQVLMVFPLYVDGMPGQVKHFFECLSNYKNQLKDKQITYIIHSGFSDGIQSRTLEKYLNRFSNIMGFNNSGVIIIPGSEGFRLMPPSMTKNKRIVVSRLGKNYKMNKSYANEDIKFLYGKDKSSAFGKFFLRILNLFGLTNMYWNSRLKKNNAKKNVYDAPYQDNPTPITTTAYIENFKESNRRT